MIMRRICIAGLVLAVVFLTGGPHVARWIRGATGLERPWKDAARKTREIEQGRKWVSTHKLPISVIVVEENTRAKRALQARASSLLAQGNFGALERLATQLRNSRAAYDDGMWHLETLYEEISRSDKKRGIAQWTGLEKGLRAWVNQHPDSVFGHTALANVYIGMGWEARGGNTINNVSQASYATFKRRMNQARQVLQKSAPLRRQCPGWYRAAQAVAQGEGWPRKEYDAVTNEGVKAYPAYLNLYSAKAMYLLPRWYGKRGDWERHVAKCADAVGGEAGDILYARIAWRVENLASRETSKSTLSWPRISRGFQAMLRRRPKSLRVASGYCHLAARFQEFAVMQRLLQDKIGGRIDIGYWNTAQAFVNYREWAYGTDPSLSHIGRK